MWEYNYGYMSDELMHYGVKGMKWGHRKAMRTAAKYDKKSRKYAEQAKRQILEEDKKIYDDVSKLYKNMSNGEKVLNTKYNDRRSKKEIKTHAKQMQRIGMPNSLSDEINDKKGTKMYDELTKTRGKDYADAVLAKTNQRINRQLASSGAAYVASMGLMVYSISKL